MSVKRKKCQIMMLSTEKAENSLLLCNNKELKYVKGYFTQEYLRSENTKSFYLYITSNDKIELNNWVYDSLNNKVYQATNVVIYNMLSLEYSYLSKIIATTDSYLIEYTNRKVNEFSGDLLLSKLSNAFISKFIAEYNNQNVISEIEVEYQSEYFDNKSNAFGKSYLKIDKNNEITIFPIKNTWNKKEVIELLKQHTLFLQSGYEENRTEIDWIKENL